MLRYLKSCVLLGVFARQFAVAQSSEVREAESVDVRDAARENINVEAKPVENQLEHYWNHGWEPRPPVYPSYPPVPIAPYPVPTYNLRPTQLLPQITGWPTMTLPNWEMKQHFDPHRISLALLSAKEAYNEYLEKHLNKDYLEALFKLFEVKTDIAQGANTTSRFEAKELAALRTARVFNEHLPDGFRYKAGVPMAQYHGELAFWDTLPRADGERTRAALRQSYEHLVNALQQKPVGMPDILNSAYQAYVAALPPTIPIVDAMVAASSRCEQAINSNKPSSFFNALEQLSLAWNFAFPGDPQDILRAKIAAEETFWQHFPQEGELSSIVRGIDDGSIVPALEAAKDAWIQAAPQCLATLFVGTFMETLLTGNWKQGMPNAASVYFEALQRLIREHWKMEEVLERAKLRSSRVFHEAMQKNADWQGPVPHGFPEPLPTIVPPIWPGQF